VEDSPVGLDQPGEQQEAGRRTDGANGARQSAKKLKSIKQPLLMGVEVPCRMLGYKGSTEFRVGQRFPRPP